MQGREVPRRALSASVGEGSLELQLSNSLELGCILLVGEGSLGTVQLHGLFSERTRVCICVYVCVCVRERAHPFQVPTLPTRTSVPHSLFILPTLQAVFLSLCCDTQADTNKSYAQKYFILFFLLIPSFITQCLGKVALHLDALVRGKEREQYLYLGARPH